MRARPIHSGSRQIDHANRWSVGPVTTIVHSVVKTPREETDRGPRHEDGNDFRVGAAPPRGERHSDSGGRRDRTGRNAAAPVPCISRGQQLCRGGADRAPTPTNGRASRGRPRHWLDVDVLGPRPREKMVDAVHRTGRRRWTAGRRTDRGGEKVRRGPTD